MSKRTALFYAWLITTLISLCFTATDIGGIATTTITDFGKSFLLSIGMIFSLYGILSFLIMIILIVGGLLWLCLKDDWEGSKIK